MQKKFTKQSPKGLQQIHAKCKIQSTHHKIDKNTSNTAPKTSIVMSANLLMQRDASHSVHKSQPQIEQTNLSVSDFVQKMQNQHDDKEQTNEVLERNGQTIQMTCKVIHCNRMKESSHKEPEKPCLQDTHLLQMQSMNGMRVKNRCNQLLGHRAKTLDFELTDTVSQT